MKRVVSERLGYALMLILGFSMFFNGFDAGVSGDVVLVDEVFRMPEGLTFCSPGDNLEMVACRTHGRPYGPSGDNSFELNYDSLNKRACAKDLGVPVCNLNFFETIWRNVDYNTEGVTGMVVTEIKNPFDRVRDLADWN